MNVEQLKTWFNKHKSDTNYQHRDMSLADFDVQAFNSFMKMKESLQQRVMEVCRAYKVVIDDEPETLTWMLRYRYMAQTNLFALCHLLEKYKDSTDKDIYLDGRDDA